MPATETAPKTLPKGIINSAVTPSKGKIGVLIEEHYDPTEFERFNEFFPKHGYDLVYLSHLWNNPAITFAANEEGGVIRNQVEVTTELSNVNPADFKAIILIGAYAMDRLRYQEHTGKGRPNKAPAVLFLRKALETEGLKVGTICHSLWLFCADPELMKGRKVTCAHNIICDVENAGGEVVYDPEKDQVADVVIDGNLISAWHPKITDMFMETLLREVEKLDQGSAAAAR
jgi:protease I